MTNSVNENQSVDSNMPAGVQEVDDEISLIDLLQTIVDNLRLLLLGPLTVGVLVLGICFLIPPTYTAKTQFLPPQQQQSIAASMLASLGGLGGLASAAAGLKNPADQYVAYLKSTSITNALIDRFSLMDRYDEDNKQDTRKALEKNVRITGGKDGLISIEIDDIDPKFAAELANAFIEELRKVLDRLAVTEAQQRRLFFEKQLFKAKENLAKSEQALNSTGISEKVLKSNPYSAMSGVASIKAQITIQEVKIGAMRGYLAETAPDFKQALTELVNLRSQLTKLEKNEVDIGKSQQDDYIRLYREFKYNETLFELFAKQYEIARVDEAREGAVIQVLDFAQPPDRKAKPKKGLITIIAILSSWLILLIFVFIRQRFRYEFNINKITKLKASWIRFITRS